MDFVFVGEGVGGLGLLCEVEGGIEEGGGGVDAAD